MDKPRECPFCGGEAALKEISGRWTVHCREHCAGTRIFNDKERPVAAWNSRADHIRDTTKMVSNADRMRSMSDEELATEITKNPSIPCRMCEYYNHKLGHCDARRDFVCVTAYAEALALDWLKQPVKEE